MSPRTVLLMLPFLAILAIAIALVPGGHNASAQSQSTIGLVGVDALTDGNTATALGARDACVRAEVGSEVTLDLTVDAVPADRPMIGYQIVVKYDASLLEVVKTNNDLMLGAVGQYQPFPGLSDPLPDSDGNYQVVIADLASIAPTAENPSGANMESGKGVLSRVTFRAKAPGRSDIAPAFEGADIYPAIIDAQNTAIGVDAIAKAVVAIGEECGTIPPDEQVTDLPPIEVVQGSATPKPTDGGGTPAPTRSLAPGETPGPTEDPSAAGSDTPTPGPEDSGTPAPTVISGGTDDGGTSTGAVIGAAVLAILGVAMVGAGGFVLYRRGQAARGPTAGSAEGS